MKPLSRWRRRILSRFTYNHLIVSGIGDYLSSLVPWTLAIVMGKSPGTIGVSWGHTILINFLLGIGIDSIRSTGT